MAVAVLALFVALGGTGYAAKQLGSARAPSSARPKAKSGSENRQDKRLFSSLYRAAIGSAHVAFAKTAGAAGNASHAASADTATSAINAANATHATSADTAGDATTLGGQTAAQLRSGIDAASLGGIGPAGFIQGTGNQYSGAANILVTGPRVQTLFTVPGFGTVSGDFTSGCRVTFTNQSGETILLYGRAENDTGGFTLGASSPELANGSTFQLSQSPDAPRGSWADYMLRTANFETSPTANAPIHLLHLDVAAFWDDECRTAAVGSGM
jgi:hypothetical protein